MPLPYFLHVNSSPIHEAGVDDELWEKWYTDEHLPDLINSGTAKTAAFYRESFDFSLASKEPSARKYLAVYQTDFEEPLTTSECVNGVRNGSDLFPNHWDTDKNGDFELRNYKLMVDYDPKKAGESAAPYIMTVEMQPKDEAEDDFNNWYRDEHLGLLSKLPGYRRSVRYTLGPKTPITLGEPAKYLAIHEVDHIRKALDSKEAEAANTTPWTVKHIEESKIFIIRGWELVHSQGF